MGPSPATSSLPIRVSNRLGVLVVAQTGGRVVSLLDRDEFRNLTGVDDLWAVARKRATRLLYATADLRASDAGLIARAAAAQPGYDKMLRECCSGVAAETGARTIQLFSTAIRPRAWGPLRGARRRGGQVARQLKREQKLNDEDLADLFGEIRRVFLTTIAMQP